MNDQTATRYLPAGLRILIDLIWVGIRMQGFEMRADPEDRDPGLYFLRIMQKSSLFRLIKFRNNVFCILIVDPDPGPQKIRFKYGSGSATLPTCTHR